MQRVHQEPPCNVERTEALKQTAMNIRDHYLGQTLFRINGAEEYLGRDGFEGIFVSGALGSGKSTGPGDLIASAMLKAGYGFAVCVAKPDELALWCSYFRGTGRDARTDIRVIQPSPMHPGQVWPGELGPPTGYRHNVLQHEYRHGGHSVDAVSEILSAAVVGGEIATQESTFWRDAADRMVQHATELSVMQARSPEDAEIRLDDILDIIMTAPVSTADLDSKSFQQGRCAEALRLADEQRHGLSEPRYGDLKLTTRYWMVQHPRMAEEMRSSIVETITSKMTTLLRSPLRELVTSTSDSEVAPERSLEADPKTGNPKVLVFNLPVKLYGDAGRIAQLLLKAGWQKAADRRIKAILQNDHRCRPAANWADEAQYFLTRHDASFQQTARAAMVATVYLTQNLPNLYAELGEHRTHSLLGNLQTKILLTNGDPSTNEWGERLFGATLQRLYTTPVSGEAAPSYATSMLPLIPAVRFTELKKGGAVRNREGRGVVGGYFFQAGRQWKSPPDIRHYVEFLQPVGKTSSSSDGAQGVASP